MIWVKGYDASFSRLTRDVHRQLREAGYTIFVQALWTGGFGANNQLKQVAEANLLDAIAEGQTVGGYINTSPWFTPEVSLRNAKLNAGDAWGKLQVVANDVEITEKLPVEEQVKKTCELIEAEGKRCPIYSAYWYWVVRLGNPQWPWLRYRAIWPAYYDQEPDIDFAAAPWGPWTVDDVVGEQYQGTTDVLAGDPIELLPHRSPVCPNDHSRLLAQVDLNTFDADYWGGDDDTMTTPGQMAELKAHITAEINRLALILAGPGGHDIISLLNSIKDEYLGNDPGVSLTSLIKSLTRQDAQAVVDELGKRLSGEP